MSAVENSMYWGKPRLNFMHSRCKIPTVWVLIQNTALKLSSERKLLSHTFFLTANVNNLTLADLQVGDIIDPTYVAFCRANYGNS